MKIRFFILGGLITLAMVLAVYFKESSRPNIHDYGSVSHDSLIEPLIAVRGSDSLRLFQVVTSRRTYPASNGRWVIQDVKEIIPVASYQYMETIDIAYLQYERDHLIKK